MLAPAIRLQPIYQWCADQRVSRGHISEYFMNPKSHQTISPSESWEPLLSFGVSSPKRSKFVNFLNGCGSRDFRWIWWDYFFYLEIYTDGHISSRGCDLRLGGINSNLLGNSFLLKHCLKWNYSFPTSNSEEKRPRQQSLALCRRHPCPRR